MIGLLIKFARPINFGFEFITHIDFLFYDINHTTSHPFFAITTNKPFGKWHEIFNDVTLANAILDRLLHHSHIININGNSYRLKNKLKIDSESSETI